MKRRFTAIVHRVSSSKLMSKPPSTVLICKKSLRYLLIGGGVFILGLLGYLLFRFIASIITNIGATLVRYKTFTPSYLGPPLHPLPPPKISRETSCLPRVSVALAKRAGISILHRVQLITEKRHKRSPRLPGHSARPPGDHRAYFAP